jgi:hypothetical protein
MFFSLTKIQFLFYYYTPLTKNATFVEKTFAISRNDEQIQYGKSFGNFKISELENFYFAFISVNNLFRVSLRFSA